MFYIACSQLTMTLCISMFGPTNLEESGINLFVIVNNKWAETLLCYSPSRLRFLLGRPQSAAHPRARFNVQIKIYCTTIRVACAPFSVARKLHYSSHSRC